EQRKIIWFDAFNVALTRQPCRTAVDEIVVCVCRARSRCPARKRKSRRRVFTCGKSHQPFRSVYYFLGGAPQNRLDGDGRILSVFSSRISFARGRLFSG